MSEKENNFWSKEKEDVLKTYAEESECMYIAYTNDYLKYKWYGHFFTIPGIIISTITGLLSFNSSFNSSADGPIIIGSLNILVAVIGTIYKILKYAELENRFHFLGGEHIKLHAEIQSMLLKCPEERDNALEFIRKIESRRLQLIDDAPVVTDETLRKFKRRYKNASIEMPLLMNKINKVKIFGRELPTPIESMKTTPSPDSSLVINIKDLEEEVQRVDLV